MKSKVKFIAALSIYLIVSMPSYAQEKATNEEFNKSSSLLDEFNKYSEKQKKNYHPSLMTYEKDILEQGEKSIKYSLEVLRKDKSIYMGSFDLENSTLLNVMTALYQGEKENVEIAKKNVDTLIEGQKAFENKEIKSFELSLMLHINKRNNNLYSQFFVEQNDKEVTKEVVIAKSESKIVATDSAKGPDTFKNKDEFIIQHKNNSPTLLQWRDYTFKILTSVK